MYAINSVPSRKWWILFVVQIWTHLLVDGAQQSSTNRAPSTVHNSWCPANCTCTKITERKQQSTIKSLNGKIVWPTSVDGSTLEQFNCARIGLLSVKHLWNESVYNGLHHLNGTVTSVDILYVVHLFFY